MQPLPFSVPPRLRTLALLCGGALLGAGAFVPEHAGYLTPLGALALFFGGLGFQVPKWAATRPLVPLSLAPLLLSAAELLKSGQAQLPPGWEAYTPVVVGVLSLVAGKYIPVQAGELKAQQAPRPQECEGCNRQRARFLYMGKGLGLVLVCLAAGAVLSACAAGPRRATVSEAWEGTEAPQGARGAEVPVAGPFSVGATLAAGYRAHPGEGEHRLVPVQLLTGTLKVGEARGHSLNMAAFGGVQATAVSSARPAWGFGAGVELTPGTLLYEVNATGGVVWLGGEATPMPVLGLTISAKM